MRPETKPTIKSPLEGRHHTAFTLSVAVIHPILRISRLPINSARVVDQMADRYLRREAKLAVNLGIILIRTPSSRIRESHLQTGFLA